MTKEEIAKMYVPCRCDSIYTNRKLTAPDCPYHSTDPEQAMDQYAEQMSKGLAEWVVKNNYQGIDTNDEVVIWNVPGNAICKTTTELFTLYKQTLK